MVRYSYLSDVDINPITGATHKRYRKVMLPAFGTSELRAFVPIFHNAIEKVCSPLAQSRLVILIFAAKMASKWVDVITADSSGKSAVLNVRLWLSKATLDAYVISPIV